MRLDNWFITNPDTSQQEVLKVPVNQNLVVKGAAGSGKTNMAIYRARQAGDNSFVIVVYTVALKKMIRYGLSELGLDKDRVVHEWSWINRGMDISGDVFCLKGNNNYGLNESLLILKTGEKIQFFVSRGVEYDSIIQSRLFLDYPVQPVENPLEVSIDFDDWVDDKFYYTFYRRHRWFKQIQLLDFQFDPADERFVLIPSGLLFKEKEKVNYLIIDEGQDFSIVDYQQSFISQANKAITIFGDTNQQLYRQRGTNIDKIIEVFKYPLLTLNYNYRIPKTVAKVAQTIPNPHLDLLTNNMKNNGNSDYPSFPKPIIKKCNSENEELQYIFDRIQTEGLDDVAILLPNNDIIEKVHKSFSDRGIGTQVRYTVDLPENRNAGIYPVFKSVDTLDFTNQDLPCILTYHSAKGTEFDNVFIPFADEDSRLERNPFYVAVTRASSRVFITYSRKLTSLLKDVNRDDIIS
ncbi:MAG: ATP-binding domain-containing protein [Bacteroidales bacterium]|jgi:superfamily I DNA/RNA helicase|nr:ATP-binding domain-containing protein [Bacteroidales bacterium]